MNKQLEKIWLLLIGLTLAGAWIAEEAQASWALTFSVAFLIGVKSIAIIDYYMEMRLANRGLRSILQVYVLIVIVLVILGHGWGDMLRELTTIS